MKPRALSVVCAGVALAAGTGCAPDDDPTLASACREGPTDVLTALTDAPGKVRLEGTPLSECLENAEEGGQLRDVGTGYVTAAQELADRTERDPDGRAAVQLGYLVGAVRRGSRPDQGLAYELVRRIEGEARRAKRSAAFRRGLRAGRRAG